MIAKLKDLTPGTPEHTAATEALNKLYKLRIEETTHDHDWSLKCEHDVIEERELAFKRNQAWWGRVFDALKLTAEVLGVVAPLCVYAVFLGRGFKFEETGTYTSKTMLNLISWFKPKK
ncbi:MAG: hypothetical protein IJZ39_06980 [Oscillospiraceae bacterium]|nr:hypothetical protein [Oscillospiraceae bacterium]